MKSKKLVLNELESLELKRDGAIYIVRNGFDILVEIDYTDYMDTDYIIMVNNPYKEVVIKKGIDNEK